MEHSGETAEGSSGGRKPRRRTSNHRWTSDQSRTLIHFLVDQVHAGMKVPKSFKASTFRVAAELISKTYKVVVSDNHVRNHYRSLKTRLRSIKEAMNKSGAGWDDATKTITFDKATIDSAFEV
jgi:hypothetical protein